MTTLVAWLALLLALGAAGFAWKLNQELETVRRRLDRYNKALFDANDEIRALRTALHENTAALRVEIMHRTNTPAFTPQMTVREAQLLHPQAAEVLAGFHMGGCSSCAVEDGDTLATVCAQSGIPAQQVIDTLNLLLGEHAPGRATGHHPHGAANGSNNGNGTDNGHTPPRGPFVPQPVKLPNVEFDI